MSKAIRNLLILASVLLIIGGIIATVGTALGGMKPVYPTKDGWKLFSISSADFVEVDEKYNNITEVVIDSDIMDIRFVEGSSFSLKGQYNSSIMSLDISEKNGVLTIRAKNLDNAWLRFGWWWDIIRISQPGQELTLTYPRGTKFKNVDVTADLGSLKIDSLETESLSVSLALGDFSGSSITVGSVEARLNAGSCSIRNLTVSRSAEFNMDSGGLYLRDSTINNLTATNNVGSIEFSGALKGKARFKLDLGSLDVSLQNAEKDLSYTITTDLGSIKINGRNYGSPARSSASSPDCTLDITTSVGSVTLKTR